MNEEGSMTRVTFNNHVIKRKPGIIILLASSQKIVFFKTFPFKEFKLRNKEERRNCIQ